MKKFLLDNFLFIVGVIMVIAYIVFIPIIGDWLKKVDIDSFWILTCIIIIFSIFGVLFHLKQKEADRKWLSGEYKDEI